MAKLDTTTLNSHYLAELIREQQLKQWWVARQIGVTPLTVNRWLTGKVRRISLDNLRRLAGLLKCDEDSLTLADEAEVRATQVEQSQAARLLVQKDTQALFVNKGQFAAYERLLKAVMHPNLPLRDLITIYSSLTMAAAEQERFEQARQYGRVRLDYAIRAGDSGAEMEARLNLVTIEGASGKLLEAQQGILELLALAESLGAQRGMGLPLLNLHYTYFLQGEIAAAAGVMQRALEYCRERPHVRIRDSLYMQAALTSLEAGALETAEGFRALSLSVKHDTMSPDKRLMLVLMQHLLRSLRQLPLDSVQFEVDLAQFIAAEKHEETSIYMPALILRRSGRLAEASTYLDGVERRGLLRIYDPPFVLSERARIAAAQGKSAEAGQLARRAQERFTELGMLRRAKQDPLQEPGTQLRSSPKVRSALKTMLTQEQTDAAMDPPAVSS